VALRQRAATEEAGGLRHNGGRVETECRAGMLKLLVRRSGTRDWRFVLAVSSQAALQLHLEKGDEILVQGEGELDALAQRVEVRDHWARLRTDLDRWVSLCAARRAEAERRSGEGWEAQALSQGLPIDADAFELYKRCRRVIGKYGLAQGVPLALEATVVPMVQSRAAGGRGEYRAWEDVPGLPAKPGLRAVASDALSFPLTAALCISAAGVEPDAEGELLLAVLGPEMQSEMAGRRKWIATLGALPPIVRRLRLLFVGPGVPDSLDGTSEVWPLEEEGSVEPRGAKAARHTASGTGVVEIAFVKGSYVRAARRAPISWRTRPAMAIAFHPGLAEHATDWEASLRALGKLGVPVALSAYHPPEAELDARCLRLTLAPYRPRVLPAKENPFASLLPHLDELFPGRTYSANAFVTLAV